METFYRYLGGPRTFWGGSNRTIINNNFIGAMPMMHHTTIVRPMPMFGHHCCSGGGSNIFNWMLGFGLASSLVGGILGLANGSGSSSSNSMVNYEMYPQQGYMPYSTPNYGMYPQNYTPNANNYYNNNNYTYNNQNQYISDLNNKVTKLEDDLATCKKQISDLANSQCKCNHRDLTADNGSSSVNTPEAVINNKQNNQIPAENTNTTQTPPAHTENSEVLTDIKLDEAENELPQTIDELLNNAGFNDLDNATKNYVKNRITEAYKDENGNLRYDITAIVHDGDNINAIINRFYTDNERTDLEVGKAKFHTQGSETNMILNPYSGDTIIARGISEFGLKALVQDAKNGITKQGEITKTNKRISDLKTAFINGDNKLSKAYVLQNKIMSEAEYDKIINEKYS